MIVISRILVRVYLLMAVSQLLFFSVPHGGSLAFHSLWGSARSVWGPDVGLASSGVSPSSRATGCCGGMLQDIPSTFFFSKLHSHQSNCFLRDWVLNQPEPVPHWRASMQEQSSRILQGGARSIKIPYNLVSAAPYCVRLAVDASPGPDRLQVSGCCTGWGPQTAF